jgi:hypothetical protein
VRIIPVPEASFNKHRRISDLLESQLQHFRHLEQKLDLGLAPALAREAHTEAGCARYIGAMTAALRAKAAPAKGISLVPEAPEAVPLVIPAVAAVGAGEAESPAGAPQPNPARP